MLDLEQKLRIKNSVSYITPNTRGVILDTWPVAHALLFVTKQEEHNGSFILAMVGSFHGRAGHYWLCDQGHSCRQRGVPNGHTASCQCVGATLHAQSVKLPVRILDRDHSRDVNDPEWRNASSMLLATVTAKSVRIKPRFVGYNIIEIATGGVISTLEKDFGEAKIRAQAYTLETGWATKVVEIREPAYEWAMPRVKTSRKHLFND